MNLQIPDEVLREAGLNEREALVEFACHLFDRGKLSLWSAAKLVGLGRVEFEKELQQRSIPVYRPGLDDLKDDLIALSNMERRQ